MVRPGQALKALLRTARDSGKAVAMPGCHDGLTGRLAAEAGFTAGYVSGGALSASHGVPDIGLLSLDYFANKIREVHRASGLPLLCDADTGFGEGESTARTAYEYAASGAAGMHLEDQVFPKRCGHLDGKAVVPVEHMVEKIKIARSVLSGASSPDPDFVLVARTDARHVEGFESAVNRGVQYTLAGADMIFPEGLETLQEFKEYACALSNALRKQSNSSSMPFLMANMTEFGKTQHIHLNDFGGAGYSCVIYPVSSLRVAMKSVSDAFRHLKEQGSFKDYLPQMSSRHELYNSLHYDTTKPWIYPGSTKSNL